MKYFVCIICGLPQMNNFISCERKNKMPKIECVVLNAVKDLVFPVILSAREESGLAFEKPSPQILRP